MANIFTFTVLLCALSNTLASCRVPQKLVSVSKSSLGLIYAPGDIIFQDEFDKFNTDIWKHEINMNGGGNKEFQIYNSSSENTFVRGGLLYIKPTWTADKFGEAFLFSGTVELDGCTDDFGCGDCCGKTASGTNIMQPIISGRLRTKGAFSFTYGKIEIRAQIPSADWTWPALWLLPEDSKYGSWPVSGEIDMMESRGNRKLFAPDGTNVGSERVGSTLHFGMGGSSGYDNFWTGLVEKNTAPGHGYDRDFHVYGIEWTAEHFIYYIDGDEFGRIAPPAEGFFDLGGFNQSFYENPWNNINTQNIRMAPFDQPFHLVLNVAVGGNYFPNDATGPYPRPWSVTSSKAMLDFWNNRSSFISSWQNDDAALKVDYVRVYAV